MSAWIAEALIASTLLMLLVLAVRGPVARMFGPRVGYALWLVPALRLLLPPLPGHRALYAPVLAVEPTADHGHRITLGLVDPGHLPQGLVLPELASAPAAAAGAAHAWQLPGWPALLIGLWLVGAIVYFCWQIVRYRRFVRQVVAAGTPFTREAGIDVLFSAAVDGPVAVGLTKRRIVLPADFLTRYTREERRLALVHEAAHHDRHDLFANLGALAVLALHWWNPIAHRAYRAFRTDQELACDATVLARATAAERYAYGTAVVKSACTFAPAAACALNHKTQLKRRIRMMARNRAGIGRVLCGSAGVTALIGGALLVTASGGMAAQIEHTTAGAQVEAEARAASDAALVAGREAQRAGREAERAARNAEAAARASHAHPARVAEAEAARADAERAGEAAERASEAAERAGREAEAHGRAAQARARDMVMNLNIGELVATSLAAARPGMVAACADGHARAAATGKDAAELAELCRPGGIDAKLREALLEARNEIATDRDLGELATARAQASIDAALANLEDRSR